MTSAAQRDQHGSERAGHPSAAQSHRGRHPHDRHDRRTGADLDRFQCLYGGPDRRGSLPHPPQPLELERPDVLDRDYGDRDGAHHRHAPYRPFGRIDHRLRLDHHRRGAGPYSAALSRPRQSGDLGDRRRDCFGDRRGDWRLSRFARRLCRHSGLHRHPRRAIVLARRGLVGNDRPDDRTARRSLRAHGRGPARLDRGDGELGAGCARLRRHHLRPLCRPSEAGAISFSATADVGRICDRGRRLLCRPWRDCDRQRLSLARACRGEIRRRQQYPGAGRRPLHFDRLRDSGADRVGHRPGHDVPRQADAVWPLRLRHRRQSGSRRARRHQHQANHGAGLCADGNAGGSRGLHRFGAARTRRPTCLGSSTSSM